MNAMIEDAEVWRDNKDKGRWFWRLTLGLEAGDWMDTVRSTSTDLLQRWMYECHVLAGMPLSSVETSELMQPQNMRIDLALRSFRKSCQPGD